MGFDAGDSNLYRYVNNSPTLATDPSGYFQEATGPYGTSFVDRLKSKTIQRYSRYMKLILANLA